MESNELDVTSVGSDRGQEASPQKSGKRVSVRALLFTVCLCVVATALLTYTLTSELRRKEYTQKLLEKQAVIDQFGGSESTSAYNLQLLTEILEQYSYYADSLDAQAMLEAAFQAYVQASGDAYACYYTKEEYEALLAENSGDYCGIGVTVVNSVLEVDGREYKVFRVVELYDGSSAQEVGISSGDCIYAVEQNGSLVSINSVGYDSALSAVRGEEGTAVRLSVFRQSGDSYISHSFSVVRRKFESLSVRSSLLEGDPTVGIVSISGFDLTTPKQFKAAVQALQSQGVQHFVFDVRGNPGGDLQSIKAVLSYFLQEGDTVLSAIDRDKNVVATYRVEECTLSGDYAGCSVSLDEIGMYAGLDAVVLCNENTASAAEVFTATMRDYGLAKIVGQTTFGKGIMQTTLRVPFRDLVGYIKLTTYAYVTKCGESYHGVGIIPDVSVALSDAAKEYSLSLLPQSMDSQLQTAVMLFR